MTYAYDTMMAMNKEMAWCAQYGVGPVTFSNLVNDGAMVIAMDGNEGNLSNGNLILIYGRDWSKVMDRVCLLTYVQAIKPDLVKARQHLDLQVVKSDYVPKSKPFGFSGNRITATRDSTGLKAYNLRREGLTWKDICSNLFDSAMTDKLRLSLTNSARSYARTHKLEWPIRTSQSQATEGLAPMRVAIP